MVMFMPSGQYRAAFFYGLFMHKYQFFNCFILNFKEYFKKQFTSKIMDLYLIL